MEFTPDWTLAIRSMLFHFPFSISVCIETSSIDLSNKAVSAHFHKVRSDESQIYAEDGEKNLALFR
jgi:hypothetical protein